MCGLTGFWTKKADAKLHASVRAMSETLHHRGPDAGAVWVDKSEGVGLGHRRLKVIDLSENGAQPMHCNPEDRLGECCSAVCWHLKIP